MPDNLKGRRKRENKLRERVTATRTANVSRGELSEILGSRHKSIRSLDDAIDDAMAGKSGTNAPRLSGDRKKRGIISRFLALKRKVKGK